MKSYDPKIPGCHGIATHRDLSEKSKTPGKRVKD